MNVHWHIGNCGKSVWFSQLMENADTYGLIISDNGYDVTWAAGSKKIYAISNALCYTSEEILECIKELVVKDQMRFLVIYTNYSYEDCKLLFGELAEFPEYCRVIIMGRE